MANSKRKYKFPKIYRFISEGLKKHKLKFARQDFFTIYRKTLKAFTIFIFIIAIIYLGLDLYNNIQAKNRIDQEREKITNELNFWKAFISKHNNYRDAYFQASILEYKLGNKELARMYLDKGLALDPNSEKGKNIERFLEK